MGERPTELMQRPNDVYAVPRWPCVASADHHDRLAVHLRGQERKRLRHAQLEDGRELVWRGGGELAVEAQHVGGVLEGVEDWPGEHDRPDRVQAVLERGD